MKVICILIFILLIMNGSLPVYANPDAYIIIHKDNMTQKISRSMLRMIFLGKLIEWPHGEKINPVNLLLDRKERAMLDTQVLGLSLVKVQQYWVKQVVSNENLTPPMVLNSDEAVLQYVANNKNAIGYIYDKNLTKEFSEKVKIVFVIKE